MPPTLDRLKIIRSERDKTVADVVLTEDARHNGVLAARAGESVPQELADEHEWEYAREGTKAAAKAKEPE